MTSLAPTLPHSPSQPHTDGLRTYGLQDSAELISWNEERGFGFARLPGGSERIFVHARAFDETMRRPQVGDQLSLEVIKGKKGKPAAKNVRIMARDAIRHAPLSMHLATAALLIILLQIGLSHGQIPLWLATNYVLFGGLSMLAYSWDKQAAEIGAWRVPERDLVALDIIGGVIGGLIAQHMLRHKRNKQPYQMRTLSAIVLHAAILGLLGAGLY